MRKLIKAFYIIICIILINSCSKSVYPDTVELRLAKENVYTIIDHETGRFLVSINPIAYKKSKNYITLKGIISYPGKDLYSQKYDTLIKGVDGITILLCKIDRYRKELTRKKTLVKADCNGFFEISLKRNSKIYLTFEGQGINTTGLNTYYYFRRFQNNYNSSLVIKAANCK